MTWIQTHSGRKFDLGAPDPSSVRIDDIAQHLSLTNRFNGATREPYSVAQHSCLVSDACPREYRLQGLLHDAAEAYVGDLTRPLKICLEQLGGRHAFDATYQRVTTAIEQALGVDLVLLPPEVKTCDDILLATERRDLMATAPEPWAWLPPPLEERIQVWDWKHARRQFLARFDALMRPRVR